MGGGRRAPTGGDGEGPRGPVSTRRRDRAPDQDRAATVDPALLSHCALLRLSFSAVNAAPLLSLPFMDDNLARLEPELRDVGALG